MAASALGVGRPQTLSALGQSLSLVFPVQLAPGEALNIDCVRAEVMAGDARVPAGLIQLKLEGASETAVRAVRLQSVVQINEPLVSVQLSLGCPARLTRQFTAFIDPPVAAADTTAVATAPEALVRHYTPALQAALSTSEARPVTLPAPSPAVSEAPQLASVQRSDGVAPRRAATASSDSASSVSSAAATTAKAAKPSKPRKPPRAAVPKKVAPRLQLEPAEVLVAAPAASTPPPAAVVDTQALERLLKLEQAQLQLQADHLATQQQLATVQLRLAQAQSERYRNPLVYALGLLSLLLGGVSLYLWKRRRDDAHLRAAWWNAGQVVAGAAPAVPAPAPVAVMPAVPPVREDSSWSHLPPAAEPVLPMPDPAPADAAPAAIPVVAAAENVAEELISFQWIDPSEPEGGKPPVTVEELIDLAQQIEFFVVLGQDEAAIELLKARVQQGIGAAALPHLKLLELLQRQRDEAGFDHAAARYVAQFGGLLPLFAEAVGGGAGLEAQTQLLSRLQSGWGDSAGSMALLQALLTAQQPVAAGSALDLQTHLDLLLLYGVARHRDELEPRGNEIDLLLPLDTPAPAVSLSALHATIAWQPQAGQRPQTLHAPLELDIVLDDPLPTQR